MPLPGMSTDRREYTGREEVMDLYYGKRPLILTALVTIFLGTSLHFLYSRLPNGVTALLSPINESLWEHVKLVFWPYLLAALWLNRGRPGGIRPWLLVLPLLCALLLGGGFLYHVVLGGSSLWVDILLYISVMILGFFLSTRFSGPFNGILWGLPFLLVLLLGLMLGYFTLFPPENILFQELAPAGVWYRMPC